MQSLVIILVSVGVAICAPQQPGYTIQAPPSNSLQPGVGVPLSATQPALGNAGVQPSFGASDSQPSFGTSGAQPSFGTSGSQPTFTTSVSQPSFGSGTGSASHSGGSSTAGVVGSGFNIPGGAVQNSVEGNNAIDYDNNAGQPQPPATGPPASCPEGEVLHVDGQCVKPVVSRNIFVFAAPEVQQDVGPTPEIPKPKVEYNIVFVRTPEAAEGAEPIIVPPPQQKTLVYVLSKKGVASGPQIIEVPKGPGHQPEVYYVNYADGENPTLPGGVDLQQALSAAATTGQTIGGGFIGAGPNDATGGAGNAGIGAVSGTNTGIGASVAGDGGQSYNGGNNAGSTNGGSFIGGSNNGGSIGGSGQAGGSFVGGSNSGVSGGGSAQGQAGGFAPSSNGGNLNAGSSSGGSFGGNFVSGSSSGGGFIGIPNTGSNTFHSSSSSSNSFNSQASQSSSSNTFSSSTGNFQPPSNGGNTNFFGGNGQGGFRPISNAPAQVSAPQIPSGLYSRPNQ